MALISRFGMMVGVATAASIGCTAPAFAAELPAPNAPISVTASTLFTDFETSRYDPQAETAEGWRRGRWRRNRRIDGGDILTGVLVLGGIAAIASAASSNNDSRRNRDYDRNVRPRDNRRVVTRNDGSDGLNSAVDQCVAEIQQDVRVESVDSVDRTPRGWIVTGALFNGTGFTCSIDNRGRIDNIDYGSFGGSTGVYNDQDPAVADAQYDDQTYLAMRQARGGTPAYSPSGYDVDDRPDEPLVSTSSDRLPAYPGGPVPGEEYPE